MWKHAPDIGAKDDPEKMIRFCNETVRDAKNICINLKNQKKVGKTLQISYYDGKRIVVIGDEGKIRCVVPGNDTNWAEWKKKEGRLLRGK